MFEAKVVESKYEVNGQKHVHITVCVSVRTELTGPYQRHVPVYSGPDDDNAAKVRIDLAIKPDSK